MQPKLKKNLYNKLCSSNNSVVPNVYDVSVFILHTLVSFGHTIHSDLLVNFNFLQSN